MSLNIIEAIELLEKDDGHFVYTVIDGLEHQLLINDMGTIYIKQKGFQDARIGLPLTKYIKNDWKLKQKPVDFMTAVRSGRKVRVEHEQISVFYEEEPTLGHKLDRDFSNLGDVLYRIYGLGADGDGPTVNMSDVITEGKWYIEE